MKSYNISVALETIGVSHRGNYVAPSGATVDISSAILYSRNNSLIVQKAVATQRKFSTKFFVTKKSQISVVKGFRKVCVLNPVKNDFMSGGTDVGSHLCRCSALHHCISGVQLGGNAIYSPEVPVFRDDNYEFLEEPIFPSFVTCAAPSYTDNWFVSGDHFQTMKNRISLVLGVMASYGAVAVLNAWGVSSGHDPAVVADLFRDAFSGEFAGAFEAVVFCVEDSSKNQSVYRLFEKTF